MIPFSGPGKYRLANGQIVNLNKSCCCKESDKVSSRCGMISSWTWCEDGSIGGGNLDSDQLYLVEKLPEVRYYKHKNKFDGSLLVKRYGEDKYHTIDLRGEERDVDHIWTMSNDSFVRYGSWIEVSEQEAQKTIDYATTIAMQDQWPKYYKRAGKPSFDTGLFIERHIDKCNMIKENGSRSGLFQWEPEFHNTFVKDGDWIQISKSEVDKKLKECNDSSATSVVDVPSSKKEEGSSMQKETAVNVATSVAKFVGKWGWRAVNYWAFEPVTEVATKVMRAVRYVTLTGAIVGGVYAYNNPEKAADLIKSCLPKITVEAPEIMRG